LTIVKIVFTISSLVQGESVTMQQALSRAIAALTIMPASTKVWLLRRSTGSDRNIKNQGKNILNAAVGSMFCCLATSAAYSSPLINASFSGDNGLFAAYYSSITNDLILAAGEWENLFVSRPAFTLNVDVVFDNSPTANSASLFTTTQYNVACLSG
jgi:hypothetical protein